MKRIIYIFLLILSFLPTLVFAKDHNIVIKPVNYNSLTREEKDKIINDNIVDDSINVKTEYKLIYQEKNNIISNPITKNTIYMITIILCIFIIESVIIKKKNKNIKLLLFLVLFIPIITKANSISIGDILSDISSNEKFSYTAPKIDGYKYIGYVKNELKEAYFRKGGVVNLQMQKLSGLNIEDIYACSDKVKSEKMNCYGGIISALGDNTTITSIKQSDKLIDNLTEDNIVSLDESEFPIYMWLDNDTIYYYTEADYIFMNEESAFMFSYLPSLVNIEGLSSFNSSYVVDLDWAFYKDKSLEKLDGLSNWNTSKVENLLGMFTYCENLSDINGLANWDTSSVINMIQVFLNCSNLRDISALASWNTSKVRGMRSMFHNMPLLENVDALANWDTSNVENMYQLFFGDTSLNNIDGLTNWNTHNVTDMRSMFAKASSLENVDALSNWNTSKVTSLYRTFFNTTNLTNIDGLAKWNISNVESLETTFYNSGISDFSALSDWDTSNVTNLYTTFAALQNLTSLHGLENWNTSKVTNMDGTFAMFSDTRPTDVIISLEPLKNWDVSNVENMHSAFQLFRGDNYNYLSEWNTSKVKEFNYMFYQPANSVITNLDGLANWDVSSATTMYGMFAMHSALETASGINDWNINNSIDFNYMFNKASAHPEFSNLAGTWKSNGSFVPSS